VARENGRGNLKWDRNDGHSGLGRQGRGNRTIRAATQKKRKGLERRSGRPIFVVIGSRKGGEGWMPNAKIRNGAHSKPNDYGVSWIGGVQEGTLKGEGSGIKTLFQR